MARENPRCIPDDHHMDNLALLQRLNELEIQNRKLKTEANLFRIITEYMNDALCIINCDGTYDYFNEHARKYTVKPESIKKIGDSFENTRYFDINGRELTKDEFPSARVLRGEILENFILSAEAGDYSGYFSYNGCPVYNEDGVITSAIVCFRDITEIYNYEQEIRRQKEQLETIVESLRDQKELLEATVKKLRQSEMQLRMASEGANAGIYAYDFEENKGIWSPMFGMIHGLKENEPVSLDEDGLFSGLHPEDRGRFLEAMKAAHNPDGDGIADLEYRINLPDGTTRWLHIRGLTHFTGEGENKRPLMTGGAVTDVTDRVLAEQKIRKLSEELRNIIDSTDDFIWSIDLDNRLLYFNAAYKNAVKRSFGYTLMEGTLMNELFHEEHETIWSDFYERAIKDGKFYVELKSPMEDKIFAYSIYPIYVNSELVEITCFAKDITDRIKTEQKIVSENSVLESTVRERTEELQQLVKDLQNFSLALSHDVKASFRDIELCAGNILKNTDIKENAERILQVSRDVTSFIVQIMDYEMYSRAALVKDKVNIKKKIMSVFRELKNEYPNQPELAFETGFPTVSADKTLLRQVIFNILSNALKFSSKREMASIKIGCVEENGEYIIYVKDNGVGFDMNGASNLFTPFVRLHDKEDYEGNGLGLSIVKNIIQRHGGRTWIESEPGVGTVVYFSLPIT